MDTLHSRLYCALVSILGLDPAVPASPGQTHWYVAGLLPRLLLTVTPGHLPLCPPQHQCYTAHTCRLTWMLWNLCTATVPAAYWYLWTNHLNWDLIWPTCSLYCLQCHHFVIASSNFNWGLIWPPQPLLVRCTNLRLWMLPLLTDFGMLPFLTDFGCCHFRQTLVAATPDRLWFLSEPSLTQLPAVSYHALPHYGQAYPLLWAWQHHLNRCLRPNWLALLAYTPGMQTLLMLTIWLVAYIRCSQKFKHYRLTPGLIALSDIHLPEQIR